MASIVTDTHIDSYDKIMASSLNADVRKALDQVASLIDLSHDLDKPLGTLRALEWCQELEDRELDDEKACLLDYFFANAWANRYREQVQSESQSLWNFTQLEVSKEIFYLRRSISRKHFCKLETIRKCQIYTNLANKLNTLGRFVDALEFWDKALEINSNFAMALGNKAYGLQSYSDRLYDRMHAAIFLKFSHNSLLKALQGDAIYESIYHADIQEIFSFSVARIEERLTNEFLNSEINLKSHKIGRSAEERKYRQWCLNNRLFLNPLNDLGEYNIAAIDVLTQPPIRTTTGYPPKIVGFFNQIKQEFVSARWLCYEGISNYKSHFSDRDVELYDTFEGIGYGLSTEKLKVSYRVVYSLFDKISFFLNSYMNLNRAEKSINFKSIWYTEGKKPVIRSEFEKSNNLAFRGLFWLSKDLLEDDFKDVLSPDASGLKDIRNHVEHKYFKISEFDHNWITEESGYLGYSVSRNDFELITIRLLKLARAAIIYLSLGMHEEEKKNSVEDDQIFVMPMILNSVDNSQKR